ncbi:MAG: hypothetical protein A2700_00160 [Candidatus Blackburnbacteria bacterium RIFCSPHIGHO2_01_FULL_44_64]|uniref:Bacterial sugar transferase domain-containing protein n=1 Tax=Candidatus Blackburnbacteria bacterium RIFCSPHIGHO2_02_FULL_44_20 TaxID=1797516 RepID=A0A1G1V801_9BACT|nr:MAG: hypothetical protein A2700_00160 [Candidatus Blackburnbacteria bacterium RIFCSPHIGHO2_01_FULL_44_64]OGY11155.1 MAG: hypothetical protein A3E16_01305 [Candidatus Blackburnbacteria bacterium RIFCSPHIGHO2_12_FULL_44_25]OGY11550.1 MAG: hypothetical protein A3D26_03300 [Candidatus Blackburnbacteria bacterium RIFCSPHIGHO2_02_FULL_44_20]OGY14107.1 MAG: hypothetical protein A3A62_01965 [Candidatus Blackburnbacteria bacterium RIFCSPLOWO2_01_FULL_44_43]OGY15765.1 MAG: hypothetical protein A3H88_0
MKYQDFKRSLDIFFAVLLLIGFSPIMLLVALAIKITSPGPVLVEASSPKRAGRNGKLFRLYKFRSMIPGAYFAIRNPKNKKLLEEYRKSGYKLKNDPRVTPVGRVIRKYSVDELPQLFNVLKGEMSIIGPRPYYPEELKVQQARYPQTKQSIKEALSVKPGMTGYWQVSGRSNVNFDKRIAIDAIYAKNMSLLLDMQIILKTPWAMISGKGAI